MPRTKTKSGTQDTPFIERCADRALGNGPLRHSARILAWVALVGGTAIAMFMTVPGLLEARARVVPANHGRIELVMHAESGTQPPAELVNKLEAIVLRHAGATPHRRDGLIRAHEALVATGWFRSIERLHRSGDGTILVEGQLSEPFAVVRWGEWDHLIDRDGRLLDWPPYPAGQANPEFTVLIGAQSPPPFDERTGGHDYGSPWPDSLEITAGNTLATLIRDRSWRSEIEAIDISRYRLDRCLWLVTRGGPSICWGISPDELNPAERSWQDKLSTIDLLRHDYGPFASMTSKPIDIRNDISTTDLKVASE